MIAIIGAVGRLSDAGLDLDDATDTVLRILHAGNRAAMTVLPRQAAEIPTIRPG